jgi:hypothetical protein
VSVCTVQPLDSGTGAPLTQVDSSSQTPVQVQPRPPPSIAVPRAVYLLNDDAEFAEDETLEGDRDGRVRMETLAASGKMDVDKDPPPRSSPSLNLFSSSIGGRR